ncbi:MAG: hypothetical protein ABUL41_03575 [Chitinophagaceae bacterium]
MEQGWDPEVKKFFHKILNSIFGGILWLLACATAGIYFQLAYAGTRPLIYTILFYTGMAISLALLIRWLYLTWRK